MDGDNDYIGSASTGAVGPASTKQSQGGDLKLGQSSSHYRTHVVMGPQDTTEIKRGFRREKLLEERG